MHKNRSLLKLFSRTSPLSVSIFAGWIVAQDDKTKISKTGYPTSELAEAGLAIDHATLISYP